MKVSVVYALPDRQIVYELDLINGATAEMALKHSGLLREFPEIDSATTPIGIYGNVMPRDTVLKQGDRLEIYRRLLVEPKAARRRRIKKR